jgi:chorismate mutase
LLGIKYESAFLAGLDEARLSAIVAQVKEEAGNGWETHPDILHGRNAAREEQGLEKLGEPQREPAARQTPARRSFYNRWLKG